MLSKVRIRRDSDRFVDLHLSQIRTDSGYWAKNVDGLGPVKSNVAYSKYALLDGGVLHSTNRDIRNLVIRIGLHTNNATKSIADMRRELYTVIPTGQSVAISLYDDDTYVMFINGVVESHEPNMFSKDPEVSLSIICVAPDFLAGSSQTYYFNGASMPQIDYVGTQDTGLIFEYTAAASTTSVRLNDLLKSETSNIRYNKPLTAGEKLVIDTRPGYKDARVLLSNGTLKNRVMADIEVTGPWPSLTGGPNQFSITASPAPTSTNTNRLIIQDRFAGF